jgi:hypothetical protein
MSDKDHNEELLDKEVEGAEGAASPSTAWIADPERVAELAAGLKDGTSRWEQHSITLDVTWKGVRSCCSEARAEGSVHKALDGWVQSVLSQNPGWTLVSSGHGAYRWSCKNRRRPPPDNSRYCRGSAKGVQMNAVFNVPEE